jgi:hypothetical protein
MLLVEDQDRTINGPEAMKYLTIYVADIDWEPHVVRLWGLHKGRFNGDEDRTKEYIRNILACAILLPKYDKSCLTNPPENLLFWCHKYHQFKERDWKQLYFDLVDEDKAIESYRQQALALGVVHPIEYSPIARQAFNWLYSRVDTDEFEDPMLQTIQNRFRKLVTVYGGNVVCNTFDKNANNLHKHVLNWRTGYFFEKLIFKTYKIDQVLKIKSQELKKTNRTLVHNVDFD